MRHAGPTLLLGALFIALCAVIQAAIGAYATDRGLTADEAAHFVNSLLILDFLREAPFTNPLGYAADYYAHLPRVSIGHWPPAFYALQAAAFALAGRSSATAMALQAVVTGLACGGPAAVVRHRLGWAAGLTTGLAVLASPTLLFLLGAVMLDTALGLWLFAAALCWAAFARRPRIGWAVLFAVCAIATVLTKGNGIALALLPLLHAAITRDARPLLNWRAWLAAAAIGMVTAPWYLLTYKLAADGFNYAWGWDYTGRALPAYAAGSLATLGAIGLVGFAAGLLRAIRRVDASTPDHTLAALASAVLALLLFQIAVPTDITPRYLVAMVPCAMVVAAIGTADLVRLFSARLQWSQLARMSGAVVAALLLLDCATILRPPHVAPFGMPTLARDVLQAGNDNPLVLVAGSTRAEGALIAAFAELDPARSHIVLRATQLLAAGNLMGTQYQTRFADAAEAGRWLADSGIGWLVLDTSAEAAAMAHNRQLLAVVDALPEGALVARLHPASGEVRLYRLTVGPPTPAQIQVLLTRVAEKRSLTATAAVGSPDAAGPTPRPAERGLLSIGPM